MIQTEDYLKRVLSYYANSFDITRPYTLGGQEHAALAAMHAHEDQYVRIVGTTLWNAESHEYTLFETFDDAPPTVEQVQSLFRLAEGEMEEKFVRCGEKLPPKDHQYTWLTVVLISAHTPDEAVKQTVRRLKKTRYYQYYLRGYSEVRMILVDLEAGELTTNRAARDLKKLYAIALKNAKKAAAAK